MTSWVLIDETAGAPCRNGEVLSAAVLALIAEASEVQLNRDFAAEHGGSYRVRVGSGATDIAPGESVYVFKAVMPPEDEGASAYHDTDGKGVPVAFCAVTTCDSLMGKNGVSVDATHELLEAGADPGCNRYADDLKGTLHAIEVCDSIEVQSYPVVTSNGTAVEVSNFVTAAWLCPGAPGPYDYMTKAKLVGAVAPPGPLETAPGDGGNYQITESAGPASETFGRRIVGTPRKADKVAHWSSRASRRIGRATRVTEQQRDDRQPDAG